MPRVVSTLIGDCLVGAALGILLVAVLGATDRSGTALALLALPFPLMVAIVLGGILPFTVGFAATGLEQRSIALRARDR
jgi:hypothetical protein